MKTIPNPPIGIGRCITCRCFLEREKQIFHVDMDGSLAPALPGQSAIDFKGMTRVELAPCTLAPIWHPVASNHWCHQYATD